MRKIDKTDTPDFYSKYLDEKIPKSWDDYSSSIKRQLKKHMMKYEQGEYCAYCEKSIKIDNTHIEHIFPKGNDLPEHSNAFKDYTNMLTSCGKDGKPPKGKNRTCGHAKQDQYSNDFINPTIDDPSLFFEYDLTTGAIIPLEKDETKLNFKRAKETIKILNLNEINLLAARGQFIRDCGHCDNDTLNWYLENYQFKGFTRFLVNKSRFSLHTCHNL